MRWEGGSHRVRGGVHHEVGGSHRVRGGVHHEVGGGQPQSQGCGAPGVPEGLRLSLTRTGLDITTTPPRSVAVRSFLDPSLEKLQALFVRTEISDRSSVNDGLD